MMLNPLSEADVKRDPDYKALYEELLALGPGTCLEIGTCCFGTTLVAASAGFKVTTVDSIQRNTVPKYEEWGYHIKCVMGDSTDPETVEKVKGKYDVVIIDGDHYAPTPEADVENYISMATKLVAIHDIKNWEEGHGTPYFTVPKVWKAIVESKKYKTKTFDQRDSGGWGFIYIENNGK